MPLHFQVLAHIAQFRQLAQVQYISLLASGLLSFPEEGVTLALDFPNKGPKTLSLFEDLNKIIFENGGRLYPAKDALMKAEEFQKGYKKLDEFKKFVDPKFSSSFWRRVSQ